MLKPLCSNCKRYLFELNAQPWEKTKLLCKSEAKYCYHDFTGTSFYDNKKESIIKNSASGGKNVPSMDMMTSGICRTHGEKCYYKSNCWGDEEHDREDEEIKPQLINGELTMEQIRQYFLQNNIKSMERFGDKLVMELNDDEQETQIQVFPKSNN